MRIRARQCLPLLALAIVACLSGCVTNPDTGQRSFNPWRAAQKLDDSFDNWLDERAASDDLSKPDPWNR